MVTVLCSDSRLLSCSLMGKFWPTLVGCQLIAVIDYVMLSVFSLKSGGDIL